MQSDMLHCVQQTGHTLGLLPSCDDSRLAMKEQRFSVAAFGLAIKFAYSNSVSEQLT